MDLRRGMKTFATELRDEPRAPRPCPLCGAAAGSPLWRLEGFAFMRCGVCGLIRQDPQPLPAAVLVRYGEAYRDYEVERGADFARLARQTLADLGFGEWQRAFRSQAGVEGRKPRFLDVGCATGALLAGLAQEGWDCVGVETCREAADYGREHYGLDIRPAAIEAADLPAAHFDIIHASHLIEHLNDPSGFLDRAAELLAPGGSLFITTPNADGLQARLLRGAWRSAIYDHLYLFSKRTLVALLRSRGFRVTATITWGGWAAGLEPAFLKPGLDRLAKRFGWGDVVAVAAVPGGA